jgi:hypothetical protein
MGTYGAMVNSKIYTYIFLQYIKKLNSLSMHDNHENSYQIKPICQYWSIFKDGVRLKLTAAVGFREDSALGKHPELLFLPMRPQVITSLDP